MAHILKTLAACLALSAALPACMSSEQDEPRFDAEDMKAAVVGTWTGTLSVEGKSTNMTLVLQYAAPGSTLSCSNRTLGVEPACIDVTTMGLKGTLSTADGTFAQAPVTGSFTVMGLDLGGGFIDLKLSDGTRLSAQQRDKGFGDCKRYVDYEEAGSCTMAR